MNTQTITKRIATAAAILSFGLAGLGAAVTAMPAPGSTATEQHLAFPHDIAPHGDHAGQGHKGSNEHHGH
jgi:hypothetical protein